jgi:hypothetical protein
MTPPAAGRCRRANLRFAAVQFGNPFALEVIAA